MVMCGSRKSPGDVTDEPAMAALHLLAARKQLHGDAEPDRATASLVGMCDLLHGHLDEIRALRVTARLTDSDLRALLSARPVSSVSRSRIAAVIPVG